MAGQRHQMIYGDANSNVFIGVTKLDAFGFNPIQRSVAAVVDVDDEFMVKGRIFTDALNA
jgi:hypothetical protein